MSACKLRSSTSSASRTSSTGAPPSPTSSNGSSKSQIVLTKDQAVEIYRLRQPSNDLPTKLSEIAGKSALVAEVYEVSPKTIRDIWNRKTWSQATRDLWTEQETSMHAFEHVKMMLPSFMPGYAPATQMMVPCPKPRGRPPGSKDSRPRKRKQNGSDNEDDDGEPRMPNGATLSDIRGEIAALSKRKRMAQEEHAAHRVASHAEPAHKRAKQEDAMPSIEIDACAPGPVDQRTQSPQASGHAFQDGEHQQAAPEPHDYQGVAHQVVHPQQHGVAHLGGWMVPSAAIISGPQDDGLNKPVKAQKRDFTQFDYSYDMPGGEEYTYSQDPFIMDCQFEDLLSGMNTEPQKHNRISLEAALQYTPEARVITEVNRPHRIVHTNEAWSLLCGFHNHEVAGCSMACIQGPATDKEVIADLMRRVNDNEDNKAVLVNYKKNGIPFLNLLTVYPIVDTQGQITHYMGTLEDITLRDTDHPLSQFVCKMRLNLGYPITA